MIPIQQLLSRIRWDREFGRGEFALGYYDRLRQKIIRVDLAEVVLPTGDHQAMAVTDPEGVVHTVPLHRIREVYRDGEVIWRRPPPPAGGKKTA